MPAQFEAEIVRNFLNPYEWALLGERPFTCADTVMRKKRGIKAIVYFLDNTI